jgi:endonuclease/exonuclease/phosphatase (EEP) superfamily protein YafD
MRASIQRRDSRRLAVSFRPLARSPLFDPHAGPHAAVVPAPAPPPPIATARTRRWWAASIGLGLVAAGLSLVVLARFAPFQMPFPISAAEAEAFWVLLPAYVLALACLRDRRRRFAAGFAVIALVHLGWTIEWVPRASATGTGTGRLRVVVANLLAPHPTPALAREILAADADVVLVEELSDVWDALLRAEGLYERYPHHVTDVHPVTEDYFGIGIFSRVPFTSSAIEPLVEGFIPMARADLEVNGRAVRVYAIHAAPPSSSDWLPIWDRQMDLLRDRFRADGSGDRVLLAGGDFNASPYSNGYRRLIDGGVEEAHESVDRGFTTTWPNGVFLFPPMRLDHLFVHGATVESVREGVGEGSDHLPLVIELGGI